MAAYSHVFARVNDGSSQLREGSKQAAGNARFVGIAEELCIEVLVSGESKVITFSDLFESFVKNLHAGVGHAADAVVSELLESDRTIP